MIPKVDYSSNEARVFGHHCDESSMKCCKLTVQLESIKEKNIQHLKPHHEQCVCRLLKSSKSNTLHTKTIAMVLCNFKNDATERQVRDHQRNLFLYVFDFMQRVV